MSHGVLAMKILSIATDSQRCTFGSLLGVMVLQPEACRPRLDVNFGEDLTLEVGFEIRPADPFGELASPVDPAAVAPARARFVKERGAEARLDCSQRSCVGGVEALPRSGTPANERRIEGVVTEPGGVREEMPKGDWVFASDGDGAFGGVETGQDGEGGEFGEDGSNISI